MVLAWWKNLQGLANSPDGVCKQACLHTVQFNMPSVGLIVTHLLVPASVIRSPFGIAGSAGHEP